MKYIVVTGGVMSGIGKGIVTSSLGALLKASNVRVTAIKIDPYVNIDAGTFSPYEHGEVFVLDDGCEVDLDLGNYERFLDAKLTSNHNITTGKIYLEVINRERQGAYLGKTVCLVPHITDAIQEWIEKTARGPSDKPEPEVCLIELGGTVGDIESMLYIEAMSQLQSRLGGNNFFSVHVNPVPCNGPSKELKSKPIQHSVSLLRKYGLIPDMIVCRSEIPLTDQIKEKISVLCRIGLNRIFSSTDQKTIYKVPLELHRQGVLDLLSQNLQLTCKLDNGLNKWQDISEIALIAKDEVNVALVGKYIALKECYFSVIKSIEHACYSVGARPNIKYIDSESLEDETSQAWNEMKKCDCMIVPGGFGVRGTEGKMRAIEWARKNKKPFLGICLGFQLAVVEYARNVLKISNAHSDEFKKDLGDIEPVIIEMLEYVDPDRKMGGTMRLGLRRTNFVHKESIMKKLYNNAESIEERHRHRYEVNKNYIKRLEEAGLKFAGRDDKGDRMQVLELHPDAHPYFVGVQYHPEYLSRPFRPSPPFLGLIKMAQSVRLSNGNGLPNGLGSSSKHCVENGF